MTRGQKGHIYYNLMILVIEIDYFLFLYDTLHCTTVTNITHNTSQDPIK